MASIVQRGGSHSVVYYTKENGIRKQKWESFRTEKMRCTGNIWSSSTSR